jgi:hypothetical protein
MVKPVRILVVSTKRTTPQNERSNLLLLNFLMARPFKIRRRFVAIVSIGIHRLAAKDRAESHGEEVENSCSFEGRLFSKTFQNELTRER